MQFGTELMETNNRPTVKLGIVLLLSGVLVWATYAFFNSTKVNEYVKAQTVDAVVSIIPTSQSLPPDSLVKVYIDARTNSLVFAKIVISFDPSKVRLSSEATVKPNFAKVVKVSTMEEANSTGKLVVAAGVVPGLPAATGIITDFVTFTLTSVSQQPDDSATLSLLASEMQLIDSAEIAEIPLIANSATYILNPSATSTPTPQPTPTPTPLPTFTPTPTVMPTPPPTSTPTPISGGGDTQPPSVSITSPANGATVARGANLVIQASASDNVGITKVEFYTAGKRRCTDLAAPYECNWLVPNAPNANYVIQAKAFDAANNSSTSQITITSSN